MRGAPQVGFSLTIWKINSRTSFGDCFLPVAFLTLEISFQLRPEAGPVPADHRLRGDDDERLLPTGPDAPSKYPEEPIEGTKARPWMPALQHGELLAKHKVF